MIVSNQGNEIIFIDLDISENLPDEHSYMYVYQNSYSDGIFGYISAKELTKNSSSLPCEFVSIEERADAPTVSDIQSDACKHLKLLLDLLNQFMKENNIKITTKNLGFENYSI